jgi:hypothetical protein
MAKYFKDTYKSRFNLFLGNKKLSASEKTYKYEYLKKTKILHDILKDSDLHTRINYDDASNGIYCSLTSNQFSSIFEKIKETLDSIETVEDLLISNIVIQETRLYDGKTLKEKLEAKFPKINITSKVIVLEGSENSISSKGSRGNNYGRDR